MNVFLKKKLGQSFLLIFVSGAILPLANALEYEASIGTGITYNDNLPRNPNINRIDDTTYTAELDVQAIHESDRIDLNLRYLHEENYYDRNTFKNNPTTDGNTYFAAKYRDIAQWYASHRIYEQVQNIRDQVDNPGNRLTRNTYETGPILSTMLFGSEFVSFRGSYTVTDYEDSNDNDTKRFGSSLFWTHSMSMARSLTFSASHSNSEPDNEANRNIIRNDYSAAFQTNLARGNYTLRLGYNTVDPDQPGQKEREGALAAASYFLDTPDHTLQVYANHQLSDTGVDFDIRNRQGISTAEAEARDENDANDRFNNNFGELEVVKRTRVQVSMVDKDTIICRTCSLGASVTYNDSDFDENANNVDEERISYTLRLRMRLAPQTRLDARIVYRDYFFAEGTDPVLNPEREFELYQARASVFHRFSETLSVRTEIGSNWRTSRQDQLEYEDYFVRAFVRWTFL